MNIDDIMRRDIADAERKAEADAYEREIKRRLRRRRLRAFGEVAGVVAFCLMAVILGWLYLVATPDQFSAECDAARAALESAAKSEGKDAARPIFYMEGK